MYGVSYEESETTMSANSSRGAGNQGRCPGDRCGPTTGSTGCAVRQLGHRKEPPRGADQRPHTESDRIAVLYGLNTLVLDVDGLGPGGHDPGVCVSGSGPDRGIDRLICVAEQSPCPLL